MARQTPAELLTQADHLARTDRPALARLCAEEAARQTPDPTDAATILRRYPAPDRTGTRARTRERTN
ncbi:hypothetical protein [Streptomyces corynorhini]|uniref:Uncharacterized protein n=1 Tax=Streptomyces corynorhini TaxID=2282652 RepID=A0A370B133_9ACTN|nr:hypothetical protein [Streptomyces corynorhini]RDG35558.1 hypothetical protein DVH02_24720 [Streptomyces corynorhini]